MIFFSGPERPDRDSDPDKPRLDLVADIRAVTPIHSGAVARQRRPASRRPQNNLARKTPRQMVGPERTLPFCSPPLLYVAGLIYACGHQIRWTWGW